MTINYTLSINDATNALGSNKSILITDIAYVVSILGKYIDYGGVLDLNIAVKPSSANPYATNGLLPSIPAWTPAVNGSMTLAALVEGQTGVDINGSVPDAGFTIYLGNDGTVRNYGAPVWFDPNPQFGLIPNLPVGAHDFLSIAMHEILHCFGFAAWAEASAPWNSLTVKKSGVWYLSSPSVHALLGTDLPLDPNEIAGKAGDHIGNTSLPFQPVQSDIMYMWGNYSSNRWDLGQLDLAILKDLGWKVHDFQDLPLVDPIDSASQRGSASADQISSSKLSSFIEALGGDDKIILPATTGNGNYYVKGGSGSDTLVVGRVSTEYELVAYGEDFLLRHISGLNGVSLLDSIEKIEFSDKAIALAPLPSEDPLAAVKSYQAAILRYELIDEATTASAQISSGNLTIDGYEHELIERVEASTEPALLISEFVTGLVPSSAGLDILSAFAQAHFDYYKNVLKVATPELGPYEALGLTFSDSPGFVKFTAGKNDTDFVSDTFFAASFGLSRPSAALVTHYQGQLDYFEGIYVSVGIDAFTAANWARGAVLGQIMGFAALEEDGVRDSIAEQFFHFAALNLVQYEVPLLASMPVVDPEPFV